jgi:protocatechuate 3,4-dioxygenase beta subunit
LYYAAAVATAIAGVLHLTLGPNSLGFNAGNGILFIVGGIAQVFWIIPVVRRWGRPWYYTGIAGTLVLIAIWVVTSMPGNPITGRGSPVNSVAIAVEVFQAAFIGLLAAILAYESTKRVETKTAAGAPTKNRQVLALGGIVAALVLAGSFVSMSMGRPMGPPYGPPGTSLQSAIRAAAQTCTLTPSLIEVEDTPQQIEGPYFVDEKLQRSDIRLDPSDGSVQDGVPLRLAINVYNVDGGGSCVPLRNAQVDIWQTNALGLYSDIQSLGTGGKKFLRGYQLTDGNGTARFTTVYPGWYEGRALHIHVKVRTFEGAEKTFEWTSQFYLDDSVSDQVQSQPPYSNHGPRPLTNNQDSIYTGPSTDGMMQSNTGSHLMLHLTKDGGQGYLGTFNVGVETKKP